MLLGLSTTCDHKNVFSSQIYSASDSLYNAEIDNRRSGNKYNRLVEQAIQLSQ